ncbi:hypothetical protein QYG89_05455 [Bacillus sp. B190/17]|uniref:Catalase n=1 Tax=Bacillus lumedeiriae TaxID=3058829 RepID=A0ABW8I6L9_9BACI
MKDNKEQLSNTPTTGKQQNPNSEENTQPSFPVHPDTESAGAGGMVSPD